MDLRIDQAFARIGLNIKHPFLRLEVARPNLRLNVSGPRLKIENRLPEIHIDQTECFADMDRRTPLEFSRYWSQVACEMASEATGRIAEEGDMLAAIEDGVTVADVAWENSFRTDEFDVAAVASPPPRINFTVYPVEIRVEPGRVAAELEPGAVKGELDWGKVRVYLRQQPKLDIQYVGKNYDSTI